MKLFITGSTGFIGRHLVRSLDQERHRITAFLGPGSEPGALAGCDVDFYDHEGDLSELTAHFREAEYDGVIHLATCYIAEHRPEDIDRLVDANLRFGLEVLEAVRQSEVRWFINVGTVWQHFNREDYNPTNLYSATKQAFEDLMRYYAETTGTFFATLKFCDTYGPDDTRRKIFALWKGISESGERLAMSPGEQLVDIVHVRDAVNAVRLLAEQLNCPELRRRLPGRTFAVTSGELLSLKNLAAEFERIAGKRLNIEWGGRPYRQRQVMVPWQGGVPVPGWSPQVSLEDGIRELLR